MSAHGEPAVADEFALADLAPGVEAQLWGKERRDRMWPCRRAPWCGDRTIRDLTDARRSGIAILLPLGLPADHFKLQALSRSYFPWLLAIRSGR